MAGPFKMKGSPMQRNFGIGKDPKNTTKTYKEAYKDADKSKYKTEEEFTKAAKAWNVKKYGTTEPTKKAAEVKVSKKSLAEGKRKVDATPSEERQLKVTKNITKNVTASGKPKVKTFSKAKLDTKSKPKTRKEIRAQKLESKKAGMSRKAIKTQKLKSKLEAADPGSRKAKRLASRYDRKTTVKAKRGKAGKKQQIASAEERFPGGITIRG